MSKKRLELFSTEALEIIEEVVLKSKKGQILKNISKIKEERKMTDDWNNKIKVEDMAIDIQIINVLKANNINTEKDLLATDISKIKGLMPSWRKKVEWAALAYDMSIFKKLPEGSKAIDAARLIVNEIPVDEEKLEAKYKGK